MTNIIFDSYLDHICLASNPFFRPVKAVTNLRGAQLGSLLYGGRQGGGRRGENGAGGVREVGEEGAGSGIPKVAGSGRKRKKLCNIAQYFAIEKMQRGGSQKIQGGNRD